MLCGNMQTNGLLISDILEYTVRHNPDSKITSRDNDGSIRQFRYSELYQRVLKLASALDQLGVALGDRIATIAWNNHRHLELYYAISGLGAVTHTINPRLFHEQISYIVNHAEDKLIFVDESFVDIIRSLQSSFTSKPTIVVMTERPASAEMVLEGALYYEDLIEAATPLSGWPTFDDQAAAALCYTSGTTGNPKGALYSHSSTILHAMNACRPDIFDFDKNSVVLPVVPMFHVSAWGTPYAALMCGAHLVLPGSALDGQSLSELATLCDVDCMLGVPSIWFSLLAFLKSNDTTLPSLKKVVVGGSAAPESMISEFEDIHDVRVIHAWGMTELSPLGTINTASLTHTHLEKSALLQLQKKQGRASFGIKLKIVNADNEELPQDGNAVGRLLVKGPWVIERYYKADESALTEYGWFDTGDVASIDELGYMTIVDREKDVVKSGGEWISSIELENIAVGHDGVKEAAVIAAHHKKWDERPLLIAVRHSMATISKDELIGYFDGKVAKWWIPDDVIFVDALPYNATGKILKRDLRLSYEDHYVKNDQ
jgi:3-(methylthio)propionyl---CoA ligase